MLLKASRASNALTKEALFKALAGLGAKAGTGALGVLGKVVRKHPFGSLGVGLGAHTIATGVKPGEAAARLKQSIV